MVSNRVLVFGGNGQIGRALQAAALPPDWHLGAVTRAECDFLNPGAIGKVMRDFAPDLVINAAAMTDIDQCQRDRLKAIEVNFHAVANIAGQCDTLNAPLIHLSTDYVFDGSEGRAYMPDDAMCPVNAYGESKMLGEEAARHGLHWHIVLRTSLVFSAAGTNVLTKTLRQIESQDVIESVSDQIANPTSAAAVAEAAIAMGAAILEGKGNGFGTFHVSGEPAVSRYEFTQAVMAAYAPYTQRRPRLAPVLSKDIAGRVPRPPYSVLDNSKTREVYGIAPRDWRVDLAAAVKDYVAAGSRS